LNFDLIFKDEFLSFMNNFDLEERTAIDNKKEKLKD